ncbi:MAG: hypothetical protein SLAVMIC_00685 [uncultured marine phage]|uniref:Uncharacterized protein n=1 Tax=uncultured marine phage TaxID=707152 RepID=A0A8D9CEL8_9VIRU|nr:MAG: hypothetical protein SLAVMIC_00685 [uncultured marine phage]
MTKLEYYEELFKEFEKSEDKYKYNTLLALLDLLGVDLDNSWTEALIESLNSEFLPSDFQKKLEYMKSLNLFTGEEVEGLQEKVELMGMIFENNVPISNEVFLLDSFKEIESQINLQN